MLVLSACVCVRVRVSAGFGSAPWEGARGAAASLTRGGRLCCGSPRSLAQVARRTIDVPVEYVAFECEDAFVIGYGLDFDGVYRSLPYVGVLKPALYE